MNIRIVAPPVTSMAAGFLLACASVSAASMPLIDAIKTGQHAAAVDVITKKSADVNLAEADGSTALLWAANQNDADLVARLVKAGANPNARNKLNSSPLLEAVLNANTEAIKALLDAGADPNAAGPDGQTPLMVIARTANVAAAKLLMDKGANPNAKEAQHKQTSLMWAAAANQGPMVRELLAHGAEADAKTAFDLMVASVSAEPRAQPRSPGGMTAMLFAAREGCVECAKALIEKGAKVDLPDPEGVTPLISSLFNAHFDFAKLLIERGANVDRWDWWGRGPVYMAVDYNTLPHGGRPDQPSMDATLPIDIVRMLLDRGANPNLQLKLAIPYRATGNDRGLDGLLTVGSTPLLRAAKAQDADAIKLLLDHGANLELASSQGMTPLLAASGIGSGDRDSRGNYRAADIQDRAIATFELMLSHGAQLNAPAGRQGQVPLQGAAMWGWDRVTGYLLTKGATINQADSRGFTALDYAQGRGGSTGNAFDVSAGRKLTADLLIAKGGVIGIPIPQPAGGRGGAPGGAAAPAGAGRGGAAVGGTPGAGAGGGGRGGAGGAGRGGAPAGRQQ
ncbi:MAG: ankyrin repeat domain-containing protein [Acidobacteriota bacterium]